jgi:bifunctional DNase/RNase
MISSSGQRLHYEYCKDHGLELGAHYSPNPMSFQPQSGRSDFEECRTNAVFCNRDPECYSVVLKSQQTGSVFGFYTGYIEACLIWQAILNEPMGSISTLELVCAVIQQLGAVPLTALVDGFDKSRQSWKSHLTIRMSDKDIKVACRISDLVALSIYSKISVSIRKEYLGKVTE